MVFKENELDRADWPLLQNGAVNLFWKVEVFDATLDQLKTIDYTILKFDFTTPEQFKSDLSIAFNWQEHFGYPKWNGNLDALSDGFRYGPFYLSDKIVIAIQNFDILVKQDVNLSFHLLDMIERHSRDYLLFGKRLIGVIQTNDPKYECASIGTTGAQWNFKERLNSSRN